MSNGLPLYQFDSSLTWTIFTNLDTKPPLISFKVQGTLELYQVFLTKHISSWLSYPRMKVTDSSNNILFDRKIMAGMQYEINDDIAIYFQELHLNEYFYIDETKFKSNVIGGYAVL